MYYDYAQFYTFRKSHPVPKSKKKTVLWLHTTGQWTKKFKGRNYYFGTNYDEALRRFTAEWNGIISGEPQAPKSNCSIKELVNYFLHAKRRQVDQGELGLISWSEYLRACEIIVDVFGRTRSAFMLHPADFAALRARFASKFGFHSMCKFIQMTRSVFKFAYENHVIETPIRYGDQFDKPPRRVGRIERAAAGPKLISAEEAWKLLDIAGAQMKAMILLGLNAGYGQMDCSLLRQSDLDLEGGWVAMARNKTGMPRRAKLWPETIKALKEVAGVRPEAASDELSDCVFLTIRGDRWVKVIDQGPTKPGYRCDALGQEYAKLARKVGLKKVGFYVLRHTFYTIADAALDRDASRTIMGYHDDTVGSRFYRERIEDSRVEAVCEHVRRWLLAGKPKGKRVSL